MAVSPVSGMLSVVSLLVVYKCCPDGQGFVGRKCGPLADSLPQEMDYTENASFSLRHPDGWSLCPNRGMYFLHPGTEQFLIRPDGSLRLPATDELFTVDEYCLENVEGVGTVPFLCLEGTATPHVDTPLTRIYPIGLLISIPFLLATLLAYTLTPELRSPHYFYLVNHSFALFNGCVFLAAVQLTSNQPWFPYGLCILSGYAIQFFFLGTFFWLNVMCFDIYWAFSGIRKPTGSVKERDRKKLILYSIYAWGIPLLILLVTIAIDFSPGVPDTSIFKPKVGVEKCFFREYYATLIYFYMPMGIIIISNIILFSITAYRISSLRKETAVLKKDGSRKHDHNSNDKERFSLYFKLFLVMGINWVMELISALVGGPNIIWYVPDITNTLQGVFIFIIFVWKRRVRRLIWAKLNAMCGKELPNGGAKGQWSGSTRNTGSVTTTSGYSQNSVKKTPSNAIAMTPQVPDS